MGGRLDVTSHTISYSVMMARIRYLPFPEKLPDAKDIKGLAEYFKRYYNSSLGKATVEDAINNYNKFVGINSKKR